MKVSSLSLILVFVLSLLALCLCFVGCSPQANAWYELGRIKRYDPSIFEPNKPSELPPGWMPIVPPWQQYEQHLFRGPDIAIYQTRQGL